ncbi:hypothetical protein PSN_0951 [Pseudomonas sp. NGC7]
MASPAIWPWAAAVWASRSRKADISIRVDSVVVCTSPAKRIAQRMAATICSRVGPRMNRSDSEFMGCRLALETPGQGSSVRSD